MTLSLHTVVGLSSIETAVVLITLYLRYMPMNINDLCKEN